MTVAIGLEWSRCPDGAEVVDLGPPAEGRWAEGSTILTPRWEGTGNPTAPYGRWIINRSDRFRDIDHKIDGRNLSESMVQSLVNASTSKGLTDFVARNGIPYKDSINGWELIDGRAAYSLEKLEAWRLAYERILRLNSDGHRQEAVDIFNARSSAYASSLDLKPTLSIWPGQATPMMSFTPRDLHGFMLMECSLAITNASALRTCVHCGTAFLAGAATKKRTNAFYCSNACRVAAQRARAASALRE